MKKKLNKIGVGADHKGFLLKENLKKWLLKNNFVVIDVGCNNNNITDYPRYAKKIAHLLQKDKIDFGILCCYTGTGMNIAANRFSGVRAINCSPNKELILLSREHNDANLITFGAGFIDLDNAIESLMTFFASSFLKLPRYKSRLLLLEEFTRN